MKLVPFTVSVNAELPSVAEAGDSELIDGIGFGVDALPPPPPASPPPPPHPDRSTDAQKSAGNKTRMYYLDLNVILVLIVSLAQLPKDKHGLLQLSAQMHIDDWAGI